MSRAAKSLGISGGVLKVVGAYAALIFVIWSMYFGGHYTLGFWKGVLALVVLFFIIGFLQMIPFGTTFMPILFEWYWHDVPFWDFSTAAWVITGISLVANAILFASAFLSPQEELP